MKSEYEQRIKAFIDSNPGSQMNRVKRIEIEGRAQDLPVYRLPIKLLAFNIENGRFAADLDTLEKSHRRKLNIRDPKDAKLIKKILLEKYPSETKRFREDLKTVGQVDPGVITSAGVVINGNRRMAILTELHEQTSQDKFSYLETIILPRSLDEAEIYKIEARLQYAREFKVDYGPVNELLKIREGIKKKMSKKALADLLGRDEKYVDEHLNQLRLLEDYSKYVWGKIDYKEIERAQITEHITDVEKNIKKFQAEGKPLSELKRFIQLQFDYIKSGCSHLEIRKVGKSIIFDNAAKHYFNAHQLLKSKKVDEESFKELIDNATLEVGVRKKERKPVELLIALLEEIKEFRDDQFKITLEIKKYLNEISAIATKLSKGGR